MAQPVSKFRRTLRMVLLVLIGVFALVFVAGLASGDSGVAGAAVGCIILFGMLFGLTMVSRAV